MGMAVLAGAGHTHHGDIQIRSCLRRGGPDPLTPTPGGAELVRAALGRAVEGRSLLCRDEEGRSHLRHTGRVGRGGGKGRGREVPAADEELREGRGRRASRARAQGGSGGAPACPVLAVGGRVALALVIEGGRCRPPGRS